MTYHRQNYPFQPSLAGTGYSGLGWADPAWASLGLMDPDQIQPSKPLCGSAKIVQQALKDQGVYVGAIDGIFGSGSVSALKKATGATWPTPGPVCQKLKDAQTALVIAAYAAANPPQPDIPPDVPPPPVVVVTPGTQTGTEVPPTKPAAGGGVTKSAGTAAAPPAGADEPWYKAHWQWLALGGVVIVVGGIMVFAAGGDAPAAATTAELKANRRRASRRRRNRRRWLHAPPARLPRPWQRPAGSVLGVRDVWLRLGLLRGKCGRVRTLQGVLPRR